MTRSPAELRAQRKNTARFIESDRVDIELLPHTRQKSSTGGYNIVPGQKRKPQPFSLIDQNTTAGTLTRRTLDGVERVVDFLLLGLYDSVVDVGDTWDDGMGHTFEVVGLQNPNGYETRAQVTRYGK